MMKKIIIILGFVMIGIISFGQNYVPFNYNTKFNGLTWFVKNSIFNKNVTIDSMLTVTGNILPDVYGNLKFGFDALLSGTSTTGTYNVAMCDETLYHNTSGSFNLAFGIDALFANTTGNYNIAIGDSTLAIGTGTGTGNIAIGSKAIKKGGGGGNNEAIGDFSQMNNTSGSDNVSLGESALQNNISGNSNTIIGQYAALNTLGSYNVVFGNNSLYHNINGTNNVAIGYNAGYYETGSNSFYLHNGLGQTSLLKGKEHSLLYGTFNADSSLQDLRINANTSIYGEINQVVSGDTLQFKITPSTTYFNSTNPISYGNGSDTLIFNHDTLTNTTTLSTATGNLGNRTVVMDTLFTNYISTTSMVTLNYTVTLLDSGTFIFPNAKTVAFDIFVNGGDERAIGTITTAGVVTIGLGFGTTLWSNTNVDLKYCIYDNGTAGILRNNSGATKTFFLTLKYNL